MRGRRPCAFVLCCAAALFAGPAAADDRSLCLDSGAADTVRIDACSRVIDARRGNLAEIFNSRGLARFGAAEYERGIADFNEAIKIDAQYAAPLNGRGSVRLRQGDVDRAIVDFTAAIKLRPDFALAF